jgi:hypothetical protein
MSDGLSILSNETGWASMRFFAYPLLGIVVGGVFGAFGAISAQLFFKRSSMIPAWRMPAP